MAIVDGLRVVARAPTQSIGCMNCHSRMMEAADEIERLSAELAECKRDAERYRTALEQIVAPFEDLNFVSGNKLLTYIHDVATAALAAKGE